MFHIIKKASIEHVVEQAVAPLNEATRTWDKHEFHIANIAVVAWLRAYAAHTKLHATPRHNRELRTELWSALALSKSGAAFDANQFELWTSVARELLSSHLRRIIYDDERIEHCGNCYYWYLIGRGAISRSRYNKGFLFGNAALELLVPLLNDGHLNWTRPKSCEASAAV